jgi:hypothetical protein
MPTRSNARTVGSRGAETWLCAGEVSVSPVIDVVAEVRRGSKTQLRSQPVRRACRANIPLSMSLWRAGTMEPTTTTSQVLRHLPCSVLDEVSYSCVVIPCFFAQRQLRSLRQALFEVAESRAVWTCGSWRIELLTCSGVEGLMGISFEQLGWFRQNGHL